MKWSLAFIPLYIFTIIYIVKKMFSSSQTRYRAIEQKEQVFFGLGYIGFLIRNFMLPVLLIIFLILLVVKLDSASTWSWWINSIPLFIGIAWKLIVRTADDIKSLKNTDDAEERSKKKMVLFSITCLFAIALAFVLTFMILSVVRLDGANFKVAIVFIPVFIILGCLLCCCIVCGPCICCCRGGGDEEANFEGQNQGEEWEPTESSPLTEHAPAPLKDID